MTISGFNKNKISILTLIFITVIKTSFALPQDPIIEFGSADFDYSNPKEINIITTDKAIFNWEEFSIDLGEIARFIQPTKDSIVLNRVRGKSRSEIAGMLEGNGNVFLINNNGLFFSKDAIIDTNSFTASTLDVVNQDFLENKEINYKGSSEDAIINLGVIQAKDGDITLLGYSIDNQGFLKAPNGDVILGAGNDILLCPNSSEKIFIKPKIRDKSFFKDVGIDNSGIIEAIQTKMIVDGNPYQYAIKHTGEIDALGISKEDGKVYLVAEGGANIIEGKITCKNKDGTGGEVRLLGECVQLLDNANIDVSANFDGGVVLIGGDYQGANPDIINAKSVYLEKNANINASSLLDGDGGKVILWSDDLTQYYGSILAQGGKTKGDGGFVEISSLGYLDPNGKVSTKAYIGENGRLLLDPPIVTIEALGSLNVTPPPPAVGGGGPYTYSFGAGGPPFRIDSVVLATYLNDGSVTIDTSTAAGGGPTGTITVKDPVIWNSSTSLTMIAGSSIALNNAIQNQNTTMLGSKIVMDIRSPTINIGNSGASTTLTGLLANSGLVKIQASTLLGLYGGVGVGATIAQISTGSVGAVGAINITAGDVILNGGSSVGDSSANITVNNQGGLTINSTGKITLKGGSANISQANIRTDTGDVNINMTGNNKSLSCLAGNGTSKAAIQTTLNGNININMTGANSNVIQTAGSSTTDSLSIIGTQFLGNITINTTGDFSLTGGSVTGVQNGNTGITTGISGNGGSINLSGRNFTIRGGSQPGLNGAFVLANNGPVIVNASGQILIQGGSANNTIAGIQTQGSGSHDITINTNTLNLLGSTSAVNGAFALIFTNTGNVQVNASGDVNIRAGDLGITCMAAMGPSVSGQVDISARNLTIQSGIGVGNLAAINSPTGDVNITTNQSLNLQGTAVNNAILSTQGNDMLVRVGTNLVMGAFSLIINTGVGDLTIVVDDNFHTSPDFGSGTFIMDPTASLLTTNGSLRVFSSRQSLNAINGTINALTFIEGGLFTDTAQEKWGTYYPSTLGGIPFTIFYKDTKQLLVALAEPIFIATAEMFRDLHPYDEYIKLALRFSVYYDIQNYAKRSSYNKYAKYLIRKRNREEGNIPNRSIK